MTTESNEAVLWRYPILIARPLFGTCVPAEIVPRVATFAESYDDTVRYVTNIPEIVDTIWTVEKGGTATPSKVFERSLDGLASQALGASVNWNISHGHIPDAAVWLWTARLCCSADDYGSGFNIATSELSEFVIAGSANPEVLMVLDNMCETLLPLKDWANSLRLLWLWGCVSVARGGNTSMLAAVERKLLDRRTHERLRPPRKFWSPLPVKPWCPLRAALESWDFHRECKTYHVKITDASAGPTAVMYRKAIALLEDILLRLGTELVNYPD